MALTIGRLMDCYDLCTTTHIDRRVGCHMDVSDGGASSERCHYGFLQKYRTTFKEVKVHRVYIVSAQRFTINDSDALAHLQKNRLVFVPLVEPSINKRDILPPRVTNKIYVTVYSHFLYFLWHHLKTFDGEKNVSEAAIVSFQNANELDELTDTFSRLCAHLKDFEKRPLLTPINDVLLAALDKYVVRG